jgi:hypothetical protein
MTSQGDGQCTPDFVSLGQFFFPLTTAAAIISAALSIHWMLKKLNRLAELQSKVMGPRINDQRAVIRE